MRLLLLSLFTLHIAFSSAQQVHIDEDFNNATLPTGWTNSAVTGTQSWSFGIDAAVGSGNFSSGTQNIDGTALAFFDDDALGANSSNTVELTTPAFDNSANSTSFLEFDYNFKEFAGIADSFFVDVYDGSNWIRVFSVNTDDCGHYKGCSSFPHARIDISTYANTACQIRFTYYDDNDWGWYVGIDNVFIFSPYANDVGIGDIQPITNLCSTSDSLRVSIINYGSSAASNFPLSYSLNGNPSTSVTYSGSINPQDTVSYTFPNLINFQVGQNLLEVYTLLSADQDNDNDTTSVSFNTLNKYNLPYQEDFEGSTQDWTASGTNSSWQIGQPNGTFINTAARGTQSAMTGLNSPYNNNESSYFTSPCIFIGPSSSDIKVSFDYWTIIESGFDFSWLEYSLDGVNWIKVLANSNYPNPNWYNNATAQAWSGASSNGGYIKASVVLQNLPLNSTLRFRFAFLSDGSTNLDGIAIDNFSVSELSQIDLSLLEITNPGSSPLCKASVTLPSMRIANFGLTPISSAYFYYQVNNGPIFSDSLRSNLLAGEVRDYQFSQSYNFNNLNQFDLKIWSSTPSDTLYLNDSLSAQFNNNIGSGYQAPLRENFRNFSFGTPSSQTWSRFPNIVSGYGWQLGNGTTPTSSTGPSLDANGDGNYLFIEAHFTSNPDAELTSPCIDLANLSSPSLFYQYHKYGANMGDLYVQLYDGSSWITLDSILGQTHTSSSAPWLKRLIPLTNYRGRTIKLRFVGKNVNGSFGDMAIDDIVIADQNNPIVMTNIFFDSLQCNRSLPTVGVELYNSDNITVSKDSLDFEMLVNGISFTTEAAISDLPPFSSDTFYFSAKPNLYQSGTVDVELVSLLTKNSTIVSDTLLDSVQTVFDRLPYSQGFDNLFVSCFDHFNQTYPPNFLQKAGWYTDPDIFSTWHVTDTVQCVWNPSNGWGATSGTSGPNGPKDGTAFVYWSKNLTNSYLYSPCFDLSGYNQVELEYWYHQYANNPSTMGKIKLEVFFGNNWIQIDRIDTVFANKSDPWERSLIDITPYISNSVQFRFKVDSAVDNRNSSIDAFKLYDPLSTELEESHSHTHTLSVYPNPNNGEFKIEVPEELIGERYEIVDLSGKVIQSAPFNRALEQIQFEADKGVYILRVPIRNINQKVVTY